MYIQYITYNFSTVIGLHVCDSWNITKQKKIGKIMQCPFIKSPLWYGSDFFPTKDIIMHLLFKNAKNTHFLNEMVSVALLEEIRIVEGVYTKVNQIQMEKNTQIKKGARTQNYKIWQCRNRKVWWCYRIMTAK